ncbi:hypothetical protein IWQ60_005467 [Tieghemiomyces parasiticus]|uniref:DNA2/NAM7 helicase-like C-terminal domain-containing protein n=1 Tax=Tieghemiomyces parasiticus TaxID=78921 RepID=A0A9W8ABP9_9FUNG|nr:hypothetical protein IWQ60_005467 [Tieghemiomyces parasiticus]
MSQRYVVLYTKQKTKKVKSWVDGFADHAPQSASLTLRDENEKTLGVFRLKKAQATLTVDDELDIGAYLLQVVSAPASEAASAGAVDKPPKSKAPAADPVSVGDTVAPAETNPAKLSSTTGPPDIPNVATERTATGAGEVLMYRALYTNQKTKKVKAWQDGAVKYCPATKSLQLYDDDKTPLAKKRYPGEIQDLLDEEFDFGRYIVIIESPTPSAIATCTPSNGKHGLTTTTIRRTAKFRKVSVVTVPSTGQEASTTTGDESVTVFSAGPTDRVASGSQAGVPGPAPAVVKKIIGREFKAPTASPTELAFREAKGPAHNLKSLRGLELKPSFTLLQDYQVGFRGLLMEHLQVLLNEFKVHLQSALSRYTDTLAKHGQLEKHLRRCGIGYYTGVTVRRPYFDRSRADALDLLLPNKEHHSKYSKHDLWIISEDPDFNRTASTVLGHSMYYGPSSNKAVEVQLVSDRDRRVAGEWFSRGRTDEDLFAIRAFNAGTEWTMMETLESDLATVPVLPLLLRPTTSEADEQSLAGMESAVATRNHLDLALARPADPREPDGLADWLARSLANHLLNSDQQAVIVRFVYRLLFSRGGASEGPTRSVTLVHGPFGTGKSYLIAVLVLVVERLRADLLSLEPEHDATHWRILITSMTNVAVDRVLMRIARRVLPFTVRASTGDASEDVKELEAMLKDPMLDEEEEAWLRETIDNFRSKEQRNRVAQAFVIGTTCLAATQDILADYEIPITILDEVSQIPEPLGLIPVARFRCRHLVMVGDPNQVRILKSVAPEGQIGYRPTFLRTQYRCHPAIADVCSDLFYDGALRHGVGAADRPALLPQFPALCFIDVVGKEIGIIIRLVHRMITSLAADATVGVIALYKEQADRLVVAVDQLPIVQEQRSRIQISTVDAFQGSEKNVIILSCVRTDKIGFIQSPHRVNVALSRAKEHMVIVGSKTLLLTDPLWRLVITKHYKAVSNESGDNPADRWMLDGTQLPTLMANWTGPIVDADVVTLSITSEEVWSQSQSSSFSGSQAAVRPAGDPTTVGLFRPDPADDERPPSPPTEARARLRAILARLPRRPAPPLAPEPEPAPRLRLTEPSMDVTVDRSAGKAVAEAMDDELAALDQLIASSQSQFEAGEDRTLLELDDEEDLAFLNFDPDDSQEAF